MANRFQDLDFLFYAVDPADARAGTGDGADQNLYRGQFQDLVDYLSGKGFASTVVSGDANNDVSAGSDGGAFFDLSADATFTAYQATVTAALGGKSNTGHTHTASEITDFATAVAANEATTTLAFNTGTGLLTYTDEDGNATNIDFASYVSGVDVHITGASFAGDTLTISDNDSGLADFTVDLSTYRSTQVDNGNNTYTFDSGNGSPLTIDTKAAAIPVVDTAGYFTATDVEGIFAEIGAQNIKADAPLGPTF